MLLKQQHSRAAGAETETASRRQDRI